MLAEFASTILVQKIANLLEMIILIDTTTLLTILLIRSTPVAISFKKCKYWKILQ